MLFLEKSEQEETEENKMKKAKEYQEFMIEVLKMKKAYFVSETAEGKDYTNGIIAGIDEAIDTLEKSIFLIEE